MHHPNLASDLQRSKNFIDQINYVILELGKVYKRNTEPYQLSYHSINKPCIDLSKLYQIPVFKTTIKLDFNESTVESAKFLSIRGGALGKSGPGARAKADASRNFKAKNSGSILIPGANGFVLQNIYCRYHENAPLSCQNQANVNNRPFNGNHDLGVESNASNSQAQDYPTYKEKEKSGLKYYNTTVDLDHIQYETPSDPSNKVQEINDAKKIGRVKREIQLRKRQIDKKYKHKSEFKNSDGTKITSRPQFLQSQIEHLTSPDSYYTKGILLSEHHDPIDCGLIINDKTRQAIVVKEDGDYVGPRSLRINQYERFKRYGVIGSDSKRFEDVSFIQHGMNAKDVMEHYNFSNNGKFNDEVMDSVEYAQKFADMMENRSTRDDL